MLPTNYAKAVSVYTLQIVAVWIKIKAIGGIRFLMLILDR
jgi:hypothetical protein